MNEFVAGEATNGQNEPHASPYTSNAREMIAASGLFDPEFYRSTYGDHLTAARDPLAHFLELGLGKGYLPSRTFDPVLYRILVRDCGDTSPLVHFIQNSHGSFEPPPLLEIFPRISEKLKKKSGLAERLKHRIMCHFSDTGKIRICGSSPEHVMRNRAYAKQIAGERTLSFHVSGKCYRLKVPPPELFLDRFRQDMPFSFARLPQGFWDAVIRRERIERLLKKDRRASHLTLPQRQALAVRLGQEFQPNNGVYVEAFMDEVLNHIDDHVGNPDFFRSASFRGFPTWDDRLFQSDLSWAQRRNYCRVYARYFSPVDEVLDGTLWKRLLISGHLKELPGLCRSRHVILIASDHFKDLDKRWGLERFSHVQIAPRLSQMRRWGILGKVKAVVDKAVEQPGPRPIVLTQCGASLAFWLINRLFAHQSKVFYVDLGQALNGWFFDVEDIKVNKWMCMYAQSVIANGDLEAYYGQLLGSKYADWFRSLRTE